MFGYIQTVKEELLVKEYYTFRAYYCGLCRELGHQFNQKVKLGLNYDMVFLAILLDSLSCEIQKAEPIFCCLHPLHKREALPSCEALSYAAFMSVLLAKSKLDDDRADDGFSFKNQIGSWLYHGAYRKAYHTYQNTADQIILHLEQLSLLEKQHCSQIDEVAHEFGEIMRVLFTPDFVHNERESLGALAYQLGRWIYLLDAFDDIMEDEKKQHYNPFIWQYQFDSSVETMDEFSQRVKKNTVDSLDHTLAQMALLYEKIPFQKNKGILFNVFYLGMPKIQRQILERKTKNHE